MISKQHRFSLCAIVSVLLGVLVDVSSGMMSIQLIPGYPVIGGSVTLSVTGITGKIQSISWHKGSNTNSEYQILAYFPGDPSPLTSGPLYNSRMTPFPDGSLQISNLNRTDEGHYTVKIQTDKQSDITVYLKIYEADPNNGNPSGAGSLGLIIGIVIAVILLLVLVTALVYLFVVHRRRKKLMKDQSSTIKSKNSSRNGQTNPPEASPEPELQYADVVFKNKPRRQQPPPDVLYANRADLVRPQETVYSDLRLN